MPNYTYYTTDTTVTTTYSNNRVWYVTHVTPMYISNFKTRKYEGFEYMSDEDYKVLEKELDKKPHPGIKFYG